MSFSTLTDYFDRNRADHPDHVWLRDRQGDEFTDWSWERAGAEKDALAAWMEDEFDHGTKVAILSRNRAHWVLTDLATMSSGNVVIPLFTTLTPETAQYILEFSETKVLVVGEAENWDSVRPVIPAGTRIISMPGVEIDGATPMEDLIQNNLGRQPVFKPTADSLFSIVFTSGTTGMPKGVMQTQESFVVPVTRFSEAFQTRDGSRLLSYLPLSHIAERQLVGASSIVYRSIVTFAESMATLPRDMREIMPNFFFGPPRVWEQLQQMVLAMCGGQDTINARLAAEGDAFRGEVQEMLGFQDADYLLTAAAPTPPALIEWFGEFGIVVMEGFGQTEAMGLIANSNEHRKIGSLGKLLTNVEARISEEGELIIKAEGLSPGYYKNPEKTAETFVDGWIHTGDKAYIDDDGFVFLTGRVKDYFKTIHGKFVAPVPIEGDFAENRWIEQQCLMGRGYSKTVMACVLAATAQDAARDTVEGDLRELVQRINDGVEKHARIGAVIIGTEPWSIENGVMTPTMKIRREEIEKRFGERAQALATEAAQRGEILIEWI